MNAETKRQIVWQRTFRLIIYLIKLSVCYSPEPSLQRVVVVSALFLFVEFNGGSAKATVMTCCRPSFFLFFLFVLFAPSFPCPPACISFLFLVLLLSVIQQLSSFTLFCPRNSSCYLLRVVLPMSNNRYLLLFSTYGVPPAAFFFVSDLLLHHILHNTCRFLFVCFFSSFSFFSFIFPFFSLFFFHGLACFVVFSYPMR